MIWVIAALSGICLIMLALLIFWNKAIKDKDERIRELTAYYQSVQRERSEAHDEAWQWENRYRSLLAEYEELEELDEAEDYVRMSLGYPPEDEDHKEST